MINSYIIHHTKNKSRFQNIKTQLYKTYCLKPIYILQHKPYDEKILNKHFELDYKKAIEKILLSKRYFYPYKLNNSQISLWINNLKVLKLISKQKTNWGLMLEDDFVITPNFDFYLYYGLLTQENLNSYDVIFLDDYRKHKTKYCCWGGNGILFTKESAKKILSLGDKQHIPNDEELKYRIIKLGLKYSFLKNPIITRIKESSTINTRGIDSKFFNILKLRHKFSNSKTFYILDNKLKGLILRLLKLFFNTKPTIKQKPTSPNKDLTATQQENNKLKELEKEE